MEERIKESIRYRVRENIEVYSFMRNLCESVEFVPEGAQQEEFSVGDIIHTNKFYPTASRREVYGHYVYIITSKRVENGIIEYEGYALSSKVAKSNKRSHFLII